MANDKSKTDILKKEKKMKKLFLLALMVVFIAGTTYANGVKVGEKLPLINIEQKGFMVPEYDIKDGKMVFKAGTDIKYRKWSSSELTGRIGMVYHLAARIGSDEINKPFIDALIAANLPEYLPDSPYKTTTILNTDDAFLEYPALLPDNLKIARKRSLMPAMPMTEIAWHKRPGD
jgi:YtfJ family uncharacterized protein